MEREALGLESVATALEPRGELLGRRDQSLRRRTRLVGGTSVGIPGGSGATSGLTGGGTTNPAFGLPSGTGIAAAIFTPSL